MTRGNYTKKIWQGKPCVLCGGNRAAEGVEHAPPKVLFHEKKRPQGLEFAACDRCNNGSGELDQLVAYISMSQAPSALLNKENMSKHELKVVSGTANNSQFPYESSRRVLFSNGLGENHTAARATVYDNDVSEQIALWAAKQTLALWFEHTNKIASHRATVDVSLFTNIKHPNEVITNCIKNMGQVYSLGTAGNSTAEQFFYKAQITQCKKKGLFFDQYHGGFAFFSMLSDSTGAKLSRKGLEFKFATNAHRGIHSLR